MLYCVTDTRPKDPDLKTVHRYVLKEMMPPFLLIVFLLTFLFMINKIFLLMELILNKNVSLFDTLLLYLSLVPYVLSLTVPMSMMVATLLAFGRLSSDMEITAFKSSGVHLFHLIAPVLVLGAMVTGLMLFFNDKVLPASNYAFKRTHFRILQNQADIAIQERVFIDRFADYQFLIDRKDSNGLFSDVMMFFRWSPKGTTETALSKTGTLVSDPKSMQVFFHMNDGVINWGNMDYNTYNQLYFSRFTTRLKLENQLGHMTDVKKDYEEMNLTELSQEIHASSDPGRKNSLSNEFQKRLSLPFACLAVTWLCAPLGLWTRSKGFIGFVLGISMIFIYYLLFTLGQILCERGAIGPLVGLWWANGIMAAAGSLVYYLVIAEHSAFRMGVKRVAPR